jgi:hypothetical protein
MWVVNRPVRSQVFRAGHLNRHLFGRKSVVMDQNVYVAEAFNRFCSQVRGYRSFGDQGRGVIGLKVLSGLSTPKPIIMAKHLGTKLQETRDSTGPGKVQGIRNQNFLARKRS